MTLTPAAAASFSTVMPVAESSGSIAITLAPFGDVGLGVGDERRVAALAVLDDDLRALQAGVA